MGAATNQADGDETRPQGTTKEKSRPEKTNEQIHKEIQDIIRQITASVTFLPSVEEKCESPFELVLKLAGH